jgi:hypothetical protein
MRRSKGFFITVPGEVPALPEGGRALLAYSTLLHGPDSSRQQGTLWRRAMTPDPAITQPLQTCADWPAQ